MANALSRPLRAAGARVAELAPGARAVRRRPRRRGARCALRAAADLRGRGGVDRRQRCSPPGGLRRGCADALPAHIPVERRPTSAVLVRVRTQIPAIEAALRARGLPVEVVGLGGLLDTPEVRDVVCTLRVLADPTDGASLLRLLTGARWRIGPRDLVALHRRARSIAAARRRVGRRLRRRRRAGDRAGPARRRRRWSRRWPTSGRPQAVLGRGLRAAARVRRRAARAAAPPRPAAARPGRRHRAHHRPRRRGRRRAAGAGRRRRAGPRPPRRARRRGGPVRRRDRRRRRCRRSWPTWPPPRTRSAGSTPGEVEVVEGAVQILTAHAAKGLEWDVVAVAGLTTDVWPGPAAGLRPLPEGHRRAAVPAARRRGRAARGSPSTTPATRRTWPRRWSDVRRARGAAHDEREERRLAYVAVTRPRRLLLCSGLLVGRGRQAAARPVGVPATRSHERVPGRRGRRRRVDAGAGDGEANPTLAEVVAARRVARRPARARGGRRCPRRPRLVRQLMASAPVRRSRRSCRRSTSRSTRSGVAEARAVAAGGRAAARRAGAAGAPAGPVEVALPGAPVGVAAGRAAPRPAGGWPARCAGRCRARPTRTPAGAPRSTPWLEQRFGAGAAARRRRAARRGRRGRRARRRAGRAAGGVPGQRVGRPDAGRGRGAVRDRRRRGGGPRPDGRGLRRPGRPASTSSTGRPVAGPTGADERAAARCSSPPTGWPGPSWPACRWSRSAPAFHYVRDGETVRPADLLDADGLAALITGVPMV